MVPEGWETVRISDIAKVKGGKRMPKGRPFAEGKTPYPYIRVSDFDNGTVNTESLKCVLPDDREKIKSYTISHKDLYISIAGTIGLVGTVPMELDGAQLTENAAKICFKSKTDFERDYIKYVLSSTIGKSQIDNAKGVGGGVPKLAIFRIENIDVPLPPLLEQKTITAILSSVDDAIQATQAVIDQTRRVKQGLMQQLLTRGIGHTRFKQTEIGRIPEEWEVMTVNEIVSLMKSGLSRRIVPQDIGIPVLISGNIQNGKLDAKELKFWYEKDPQGARVGDYILKDGDILLCFINSLKQIGKLCIYEDIGRSAIYTTNLFRIQLKQTYSPNFGYYIFSAPFFQKEIDLITKPAVNQASFTKADFLRILIPIPPKEERDKVVKILESVDYNLETAQIQLRTVQKLKRGLMQDLLTGSVRVKLDGEATT